METCDSFSEYKPTRVIPHIEVHKSHSEIGPEAQKKLREIIAKAETFLIDLSLSKGTITPEIYAKTASSTDKKLQTDIVKVLQAVATLLQWSEEELLNNIREINSDFTEIPSAIRKKREDEDLIAESNHLIKQLNIIKKCLNFLTPFIVIEIDRIKSPYKLEFSIFRLPIEAYHSFYRKHFMLIDKISNSCEPLLEKLAKRITENQNKHILYDKSCDVLSYANTIESKDAKNTVLNFKVQTDLIQTIYNKICIVKKEMDNSYSKFKLKCNYFMHLCAFQKRPKYPGYYSTVFELHYPTWYNYLAEEILLFSFDDLLIDRQYRQLRISNTYTPPLSKDQRSTGTYSPGESLEDISAMSSNVFHLEKSKEEQLDSVDLNHTSYSSGSSSEESPSRTGHKKMVKSSNAESFSEDDISCLGGPCITKNSS
ncbi:MAG: hypothetical protein H0T62_12145 [Parachlamydiaceae bacterium]|nr:hypothetical protein [Parachlamydiaceae bacterium]